MFNNMKLGVKLLTSFLTVGILPLLILGLICLQTTTSSFSTLAFNQLESVREIKKKAVESYLQTIKDQMVTFAESSMIVDAMGPLKDSFKSYLGETGITGEQVERIKAELLTYYQNEFTEEFKKQNNGADPQAERFFRQLDDDSLALQHAFIRANHHPLGSKHLLDSVPNDSTYNKLHAELHPIIRNFLDKFGYYDIFLVDSESGDIVYSVFKELDYTTSLTDGPYAQTNFGEAFRKANMANKGEVVMVDYATYFPSYEAPAGFVAAPVYDGDQKIGVAMFQFPIDRLNVIMGQRDGLGESGESYLIGADLLMRSDSYHDPLHRSVRASFTDTTNGRAASPATKQALEGKTDSHIGLNYLGTAVLSSFTPLRTAGLDWALITEISEAEAFAAIRTIRWVTFAILLSAVVTIIIAAFFITHSIAKPVREAAGMIMSMEKGHLDHRLRLERNDEIGRMGAAMDAFADSLQNEIVGTLHRLAAGDLTFKVVPRDGDDEIRGALKKLGEDLNGLMGQIYSASEEIAMESTQVSSSSQSLSQGATSQASALAEITTSMHEMEAQTKRNAANSKKADSLSSNAKEVAHKGNIQMKTMVDSMATINESSHSISKIIKAIDEIAFQTNLLALNAAVEAARAGQHGKGFAVVAEEVRNLAARCSKAAQETSELIADSVTRAEKGAQIAQDTALSLDEIVSGISQVSALVAEIARASGEQAEGIAQVSLGLNQIDQVTHQNTANAEESASAADELSCQAMQLKEMLGRFKLIG